IGLLILKNDHAFLLGFITCLFDIIPVIGPAVAITIGLIMSISNGFVYVILTFLVFIIAQWAQNQFLRPIIFGKLLNMHPLMIIIALLVGARFLGLWGVLLAPAMASVVCLLVDELYLNRINK
ncbi:MAG: AI-2E family transporter, partial [Candidatus Gastranaerophilales bacterium]|nr:AI-2E family transporter [Candidatus Gastranaerophilales bacterium]